MRKLTSLELKVANCEARLAHSEDPRQVQDALLELGMAHINMEPAKFPLGIREVWESMNGRSLVENIGIVASVVGFMSVGANNPEMLEYAAALHQDQLDAIPKHAGEQ